MNTYVLLVAAVIAAIAAGRVLKYLKGQRDRAMARVAELASVEFEEYGPETKLLESTGPAFFRERAELRGETPAEMFQGGF